MYRGKSHTHSTCGIIVSILAIFVFIGYIAYDLKLNDDNGFKTLWTDVNGGRRLQEKSDSSSDKPAN